MGHGLPSFNVYGGIYRDVRIVARDRLHIPFQGSAQDEGVVNVKTYVRNDSPERREVSLRTTIYDAEGRVVARMNAARRIQPGTLEEFNQTSPVIRRPRLWSPESPYLYRVQSEVWSDEKLRDAYGSPLGFRWFRWDRDTDALYLNGRPVHIHGTNRHQEYPWLGDAIPKWLHAEELRQIRGDMGMNFLRATHYPNDPILYDHTDRLRIITVEEVSNIKSIDFGEDIQACTLRELHPRLAGDTSEVPRTRLMRNQTHRSERLRVAGASSVLNKRGSVAAGVSALGNSLPQLLLLTVLLLGGRVGSAQAQEAGPDSLASREEAPRVYLDCNRCDFSYIRREIPFVNHVRDPGPAQIHVLITDQPTGGGGRTFTLAFQGRGPFVGQDQTLTYTSLSTYSGAQEREGLTEMLKLGLVPYLTRTRLAAQLRLSFEKEGDATVAPPDDRWNSWTFQLYGGGNFHLEATQSAWNARYGLYADRVTDDWKIRVRPYFNNNERIFRRGEDVIRSDQRRHGLESYVIRSLGNYWGAGIFGDYITTTFDNLRHRFSLAPGVEYSLFPYEESSRRQVTLAYQAGMEVADYFEETIYGRTAETLAQHSLNASVQFRQPWGSVYGGFRASNYLHNLEHYRLTFDGRTSFRLGTGLSLNFGGSFQRIHDQLNLPRGDASLEEILLQQRRLATSYRASGEVGLSYTFGSIYSNVVNPRF